LIRIFSVEDGVFLQEVRRGAEKAEIYCLCFDLASKFIACSSDRGTIHLFSLATAHKTLADKMKGENFTEASKTNENEEAPKNPKSFFGKMSKLFFLPNYFKSEFSFAQFRIPDLKSICAFGPNNTIIGKITFINYLIKNIVVSSDGKYYQASFDPKNGGECTKLYEYNLNLTEKDAINN